MICPVCKESFIDSDDYIDHMIKDEHLTIEEIESRLIIIGMLTKRDVEKYKETNRVIKKENYFL